MNTKKMLSVLLAALMLASLCVTAFAEDVVYRWKQIPTSPDGLNAGDLYFDFPPADGGENAPTQAEYYAFVNSTWYVDEEHCKARVVWCADADESVTHGQTEEILESTMLYYVKEVGIELMPISTSLLLCDVGDWYLDPATFAPALQAAYEARGIPQYSQFIAGTLQGGTYKYCVNPNGTWHRYIQNFGNSLNEEDMAQVLNGGGLWLPAFVIYNGGNGGSYSAEVEALDACLVQVTADMLPETDWHLVHASAEGLSAGEYYLDPAIYDLEGSEITEEGMNEYQLRYEAISGALTITVDGMETFLPEESAACFAPYIRVAPSPETPAEPDEPAEPENPSDPGGQSANGIFAKIAAFFQRIIQFFRNLFSK